ncbi:MAG: phosphotransferase [Actinomycetota bacterium]
MYGPGNALPSGSTGVPASFGIGRDGGHHLELSNVVFQDGVAVALIDLEFAAPGRPVYDLAHLARLCVRIDDDADQRRLGWTDAERPARLRLVADSYGLDEAGRRAFLSAIEDALNTIEFVARRSIADGDAAALAVVERTGGIEKYDRRRDWWATHHAHFAAALS